MRKVADVGLDEVTENDTFPFFVSMVTGADEPFIFVPESPLTSAIVRVSLTGAVVLLQSDRSTEMVDELLTCVVLGETYTCELSTVGVPAQEDAEDVSVVTGSDVTTGNGVSVTIGYGVGVGNV
jgi:hypothetical protein